MLDPIKRVESRFLRPGKPFSGARKHPKSKRDHPRRKAPLPSPSLGAEEEAPKLDLRV